MPVNFRPGAASMALAMRHHFRRRLHAAAPRAAVDLDQTFDACVPCFTAAADRSATFASIVDADRSSARPASAGAPAGRSWPGRAPGCDTSTSLMPPRAKTSASLHLLAADADRPAQPLLQQRHIDRLVHLAMHPVPHPMRLGKVAHLHDVALQRVEVEHQAGRLDIRLVHPRQRRNVVAHFQAFEIRLRSWS